MRINRKKRLLAITLAGLMACGMAACGGKDKKETTAGETTAKETTAEETTVEETTTEKSTAESTVEESSAEGSSAADEVQAPEADSALLEVIQQIYELRTLQFGVIEVPVDLTQDYSLTSYTGLSLEDGAKVDAAVASEAMISAQAYSLVLVRAKDKADVPQLAQAMADGIDQRKWVCVEADDMQVVTKDDLIMLIMIQSELSDSATSQDIVDAFAEVVGEADGKYTKKTK